MTNLTTIDAKDIDNRRYMPALLRGGVDQETSKFNVPVGTMSDCLNYNASTRGYQRAQGLFYYDGTFDGAVSNMWVVGVMDDEAPMVGSGFTLGGAVTWGDGYAGIVVYYERISGTIDTTMLGIVEIVGEPPTAGDTLTDVNSGTTLTLGGTLRYNPTTLGAAVYPETGTELCATITEYLEFLNDTVNANLVGQEDVVTGSQYNTYHGAVPGIGQINGGWQLGEDVYVVRDAYSCTFVYGTSEFRPGDEVILDTTTGSETALVASVELTSGYWSQGTASGKVVLMPSTNTIDFRDLANIDVSGNIYSASPVTALAQIDDIDTQYGSLVWKGTVNGWEWVNTGWTIGYNTGTNAPNVKSAPLFQADLIRASREVGPSNPAAGSNEGSSPYVAWTNPSNVTTGAATECVLGSGQTSQFLKCQIAANTLPHDDIRVIGIEISITSEQTAGVTGPSLNRLSIINETAGANFYQSANKADNANAPATATSSVYGGEYDTWGIEELPASDLNSGDCYFILQYYGDGSGGTVELTNVEYTVYYTTNNEKVWFYDGTADVSTAEIHAYQQEGGDFGSANNAYGSMSLRNVSAPEEIGIGMSMYTEPNGAGLLVAKVNSAPEYNLLPSSDQHTAEESQYEAIRANFYENDESEAVYGVTGAGPAFTYDGTAFSLLKTPLARVVDKPRHIAFHDNRLALGYESGHVILSAVGQPNNFSGVDSSSSWGVGDRVTGLISLSGQVLGVFSEASINSLEGSSESTGTMRTISSTTGVREYTLKNVIGPYYADNRGIGSLTTSDRYGDFDLGRLSDQIRTWVQDRLQEKRTTQTKDTSPANAVAVRNKNQYRIFFNDGYILVFYFHADGAVEPTFMHYDTENLGTDYVPTWIDSHVLPNGRERVMMGTKAGEVYVVDGANVIQHPSGVTKPDAWFVLNPVNFQKPHQLHKHYHAVLQGQFYGAQTVKTWASGNYVFDETGSAQDTITLGDYSDAPVFTAQSEVDSTYLPALTDGFTMKVQTSLDGSQPHTFQAVLFRASGKGIDRNRAPKAY